MFGVPCWPDPNQTGTVLPIAPPTNSDFFARYAAFADVTPALVTAVLAEAASEVNSAWRVSDQVPAVMAFAAHLLASEGLGSGALDLGPGMAASGPVTSYQAGDTKISFALGTKSSSMSDLSSTSYGRRFLELSQRNSFVGALVV